jgi:hypothetical protein
VKPEVSQRPQAYSDSSTNPSFSDNFSLLSFEAASGAQSKQVSVSSDKALLLPHTLKAVESQKPAAVGEESSKGRVIFSEDEDLLFRLKHPSLRKRDLMRIRRQRKADDAIIMSGSVTAPCDACIEDAKTVASQNKTL